VKEIEKAILVTGTPGVGKTTIANKLASKLNVQCISVTELVKTERLFAGKDEDRATLIADTKRVTKRLQEIIDNSERLLIIEGHYATDVVPKKYIKTVFIIRRDPIQLKNILEKREYSERKLWENLAAEILDVCLYEAISTCGANKVCEIDSSNKTVDTVLKEIGFMLKNKEECRIGVVDWLGKLEQLGQLENYLKT
jgi:adenylate kinase